MARGLTNRQSKFVELWNGNPTETAEMAGYSCPKYAGIRCMKNVTICHQIQEKRAAELKPQILNRQERQKFWTDVIKDADEKIEARLKSSELLGRSEGDFLDRTHQTGDIDIKIRWADE